MSLHQSVRWLVTKEEHAGREYSYVVPDAKRVCRLHDIPKTLRRVQALSRT
jgi:hypothetical protein